MERIERRGHELKRFFLLLGIGFFSLLIPRLDAQSVGVPTTENPADVRGFEGLDAREAGKRLLTFRKAGKPDLFAQGFKTWLDSGKTVREILGLLRITGLPFGDDETGYLADFVVDYDGETRNRNLCVNGYSLEAYGGNRLELVLLNEDERKCYARALQLSEKRGTSIAHFMTAELEGRLCVWTGERKIHLGGPHFEFERVARIRLNPPTPEDLAWPPDEGGDEAPASSTITPTGKSGQETPDPATNAFDSSF